MLGLLNGLPVGTDLTSKPWVVESGVEVLNQRFFANDNVATAGGCMASQYLATWIMAKLAGDTESAIHYVESVGEKEATAVPPLIHRFASYSPMGNGVARACSR